MAKRKRKVSKPAAGSIRRRKSTKRSSSRRRGLSAANIPLIGTLSLNNPLIGGAVGGWAASLIKDEVQDTIFGKPAPGDDPKSFANQIQPYAKGIVLAGVAFMARRFKYPEVSAGIMGAAAAFTRERMQHFGVLKEGSSRRQLAGWAMPDTLNESALLSGASMLSEVQMLSAGRRRRSY